MPPPGSQPPVYIPSAVLTQHPPARTLRELRGRDLLTLTQLAPTGLSELYTLASKLKQAHRTRSDFGRELLRNHTAILIFEKASLRTRITFETGFAQLGGHAIYMDHSTQRLGVRESVQDYGKNLERWLSCVVARVYSQEVIEELALHCAVPVINALSDRYHPCQGLADMLTLWELRDTAGAQLTAHGKPMRVAYVGDGNNVCHSLMHACSLLGAQITVIHPRGYGPDKAVTDECERIARTTGGTIETTTKLSAIEAHHAVYTDVWVSMGQADEEGKRMRVFGEYQVDGDLMTKASQGLPPAWGGAKFMHCLPARRGVEVTDEVIDSPQSIVYEQAENRMHAQNALLAAILSDRL